MGGPGSGKREPKRKQYTGLLGVIVATDIPARVLLPSGAAVAQWGGPEAIPRTCPKCHIGAPMWAVGDGDWEGCCRACGADWFRTRGAIRFGATMQTMPVYEGARP